MEKEASENEPYKDIAQGLNSPEIKRNTNIPFADDFVELDHVKADEPIRPLRLKDVENGNDTKRDGKVHASDLGAIHSPNSDTIVVDTPEGTLYITLDPDSAKSSKPTSPISPSTESTDLSSPSTSKAVGAEDSIALIENEIDVEQRRANLRRNSISLPTLPNLELEVLKQQYLQNPQDEVSLCLFLNKPLVINNTHRKRKLIKYVGGFKAR